uniref:Uncharacterized protein n=1 Tax=Anopheles maculatus TaxID=74869 RepID=A0A182SLP3_9DIPT
MLYRRSEDGNRLLADIAEEAADETIKKFLRMTEEDFDYLLNILTPLIMREDTYMRKAVTARERLIITLRFLATGDSYSSLQFLFRGYAKGPTFPRIVVVPNILEPGSVVLPVMLKKGSVEAPMIPELEKIGIQLIPELGND